MAEPLRIRFATETEGARAAIANLTSSIVSNSVQMGSALKSVNDNAAKVSAGISGMGAATASVLPVLVAVVGAVVVYKAISAAVDVAKESIEEYVKVGKQASEVGVGTGFLQRWKGQAGALKVELADLDAMLKRAREASTTRIGEGDNAASSTMQDRLQQNVKAGNLGRADLDRFTGAKDQEGRIRVILDMIDQLQAKGARLAAFDIAGKMFGDTFEQRLRDGIDATGKMREALDSAATTAAGKRIISEEEIDNATKIAAQLERIDTLMASGLAPIQRDLITLGQEQYQGWLNIKESIASVVHEAGKLYGVVKGVLADIDKLTGMNPMAMLADKLGAGWIRGKLGIQEGAGDTFLRTNGLGSLATYPDLAKDYGAPDESTRNKTGGPAAAPLPAIAVRRDRSNSLPSLSGGKAAGAGSQADSVETFIAALEKSTAALKAEAETYGKSNVEKQKAIALAKAEEIAKQRGSALTDAEIARINSVGTAAGQAKDRLAELQQQAQQAAEAMREFGQMGTDALAGMILEGRSFSDVVNNIAKQLAKAALQAALMGTGPLAGLMGTAPAPGATGASSVGGLLGQLGGMFSGGSGLASGWMPRFAAGGYTGHGGKDQPAGIVHGGEYVFDKAATSRIGVGNLEAIRRGMKGFSEGGFVGAMPRIPTAIPAGGREAPLNLVINSAPGVQNSTRRQGNTVTVDQTLRALENGLAGRGGRGQGPLKSAIGGPGYRKG